MRQEIKEVYELLQAQKEIQTELLKLGHLKRRAIVRADTGKLTDIVGREQFYVSKMNSLERKRTKLMPELSALVSRRGGTMTLGELIDSAQPEEREALNRLGRELRLMLFEQLELNSINSKLLEDHLCYAETMISAAVGREDPLNNFYGGDGRCADDRPRKTGFFDRQI
ncbi:MAG: flagellar protein FlgN [Oscillospiraceae bacterium]|nr:flagellar protein FlgN [Oscillospiraceae bacterium]